jgi:hypothetical protein
MSIPSRENRAISLDEASRQLELAVHDAQVAYDCIALGNLDRAHTNAITARAAVDAAETVLRAALGRDAPGGTPSAVALLAAEAALVAETPPAETPPAETRLVEVPFAGTPFAGILLAGTLFAETPLAGPGPSRRASLRGALAGQRPSVTRPADR